MTLAIDLLAREHNLRVDELHDKARKGLLNFTCCVFKNYEVNWHHRIIARALNKVVDGTLKRVIFTMPPRFGKSTLISHHLPAYVLGRDPRAKIISASYGQALASRNNREVQRIIESPAYQQLFPNTRLSSNAGKADKGSWLQNASMFETVGYGGCFISAGVGSSLTGFGAGVLIVDDATRNREEADSQVYRDKTYDWYTSTFSTRAEKDAAIVVVCTRWHEDDLIGRLLKLAAEDPAADQWTVINLPAICELTTDVDPREPGEPLWPGKYDLAALGKIKASVGSRNWTALYQQRPAPEGGAIIKREWWRYYKAIPEGLDTYIQAWDLAFTGKEKSDYVVGVVLARKGANIYLLDMIRAKLTFTETVAAFRRLSAKWPNTSAKLVELAANGHALVDSLQKELPGIIGVRPTGTKVARVNSISPRIEAGNVWLPDPSIAPWIHDVVEEWTAFPTAQNDDVVDAMVHGLIRFAGIVPSDWVPLGLVGSNYWAGPG